MLQTVLRAGSFAPHAGHFSSTARHSGTQGRVYDLFRRFVRRQILAWKGDFCGELRR